MSPRREFWRGYHRFLTGVVARCPVCGVTVDVWGGFYLGTNSLNDPFDKKESRCPRCYSFPCKRTFEEGTRGDMTIFRDWEPPDYPPTCDVCGRRSPDLAAVGSPFMPGRIMRVCRHGHFQGVTTDPHTGLPTHLTGPKMLDALLWYPEGFVAWMKRDLWAEVAG